MSATPALIPQIDTRLSSSRKKIKIQFFPLMGMIFLFLLLLLAIFGPNIGGGWNGPIGTPFLPPGHGHILGTDELGRDVLARLSYGARLSLAIGSFSLLVTLVVGIVVGLVASFGNTLMRNLLMRFTDAMFSFPDILLAILIAGVLQTHNFANNGIFALLTTSGIFPVVVALSITSWPAYARLVYTQSVALKEREFVVASKALGASPTYLAFKHVLPQLWALLAAIATIDLAGLILAESSLSFLGIGVLPPFPSWGSMINSARDNMQGHPLWLFWPCLLLSLTIFALNFVGEWLRRMLDKGQD